MLAGLYTSMSLYPCLLSTYVSIVSVVFSCYFSVHVHACSHMPIYASLSIYMPVKILLS